MDVLLRFADNSEILRQIKDRYGDCSQDTVETVIKDILDRYLGPDYFQELDIGGEPFAV
jgi:hypothetical protein